MKHAELIKAWAEGAIIQARNPAGDWRPVNHPRWYDTIEYRVKPTFTTLYANVTVSPIGSTPRYVMFDVVCNEETAKNMPYNLAVVINDATNEVVSMVKIK